ncbi:85/88 kDa calcium-independent phospholipase A2 [Globodera pallida]|nr:85/88 kDa calcium-independent phospholipase A2 [Globodera pallida]
MAKDAKDDEQKANIFVNVKTEEPEDSSDPFEVVDFRPDLLASHKIVYPEDTGGSMPSLIVVQGSIKNEQSMPRNHVVYTVEGESGQKRTFTIFRQCEECRVLFRSSDQKKDMRKLIWDVTFVMKEHPLWRMAHIAILCQRVDIFTDDGLAYLQQFEYSVNDVVHVACSPEGIYPLMLAIQTNQESIVRFLLKHGADLSARDPEGNNAIHYAALVSSQMLETLLEHEAAKALIDSRNNVGETPSMVALGAVNTLGMKTLFNFSEIGRLADEARASMAIGHPSGIPGCKGRCIPDVPKKQNMIDPRNLRYREVQAGIIRKVVQFLADRMDPAPPFSFDEPNFLRYPSKNDFKNVFQYLFQCIEPTFQVQNIEQDALNLLNLYGYPYTLNANTMQTITYPTSWGQLLGALDWMIDIVEMANEMHKSMKKVRDDPQCNLLAACFKKLMAKGHGQPYDVDVFKDEFEDYRRQRMTEKGIDFKELVGRRVAQEQRIHKLEEAIARVVS